MHLISIDGACRRNGKANCVSSGCVFIQKLNGAGDTTSTLALSSCEKASTNQRGELLALRTALSWLVDNPALFDGEHIQIVTDSEYLFNAMTKLWFNGWANRGWLTAAQEPVKNADLWKQIAHLHRLIDKLDVNYYHIKGHCIPFGRVTADKLLDCDSTGALLLGSAVKKFDDVKCSKASVLQMAQDLSYKNNGFYLPEDVLTRFITANVVVDAIATKAVDEFDREVSLS